MKIAISACLLGQEVRYDGTGKCQPSIISALDNLVKGASGQAVQNMNLAHNFKEQLGLK